MSKSTQKTRLLVGKAANYSASPTTDPPTPAREIKTHLNKRINPVAGDNRRSWLRQRMESDGSLTMMLFFAAIISTAACHKPLPQPSNKKPEVTLLAIMLDGSTSSATGGTAAVADLRCAELTARVRAQLDLRPRHLEVLVLATGDTQQTASEPLTVQPWIRFSRPTEHLFGKQISLETEQKKFLALLDANCRRILAEQHEPPFNSPVILAWQRTIESVAAHAAELSGRGEVTSNKIVAVHSDLRETADARVVKFFRAITKALKANKPIPAPPADLPKLSLSGLTTRVCGVSEHVALDDKEPPSPETLTIGWGAVVGTSVPFEPSCPRDTILLAQASSVGVAP